MRKATVIYSEFFQVGSHHNHVVKTAWVDVADGESLGRTIEAAGIDIGQVWTVFEGHQQEAAWE